VAGKEAQGRIIIEAKGEMGKANVFIQDLAQRPYRMAFITQTPHGNTGLKIGSVTPDSRGRFEGRFEFNGGDIGGSGIGADAVMAVVVYLEENGEIVAPMTGYKSAAFSWKVNFGFFETQKAADTLAQHPEQSEEPVEAADVQDCTQHDDRADSTHPIPSKAELPEADIEAVSDASVLAPIAEGLAKKVIEEVVENVVEKIAQRHNRETVEEEAEETEPAEQVPASEEAKPEPHKPPQTPDYTIITPATPQTQESGCDILAQIFEGAQSVEIFAEQGEDAHWVTTNLENIACINEKTASIAASSFAQTRHRRYRHVLLGRVSSQGRVATPLAESDAPHPAEHPDGCGEVRYLLGIPDTFNPNNSEHEECGLKTFKCCRADDDVVGAPGYWLEQI